MDIMTSIHTILVMDTTIIFVKCTVEEDILAVIGEYKCFYDIDKLHTIAYNEHIVPMMRYGSNLEGEYNGSRKYHGNANWI